jgi:antitoxin component of MazEF toxin-antitoxin module
MRTLTISKIGQPRKTSKYGSSFTKWVNVPFIRLSGKYLQHAGFEIGDSIEVEFCKDFIILKHPSPARQLMENKNPQLTHLINELQLIEVA